MDELTILRDRLLDESNFIVTIQASPNSAVNELLGFASVKQLKLLVDAIHNIVLGNCPLSRFAYDGLGNKLDSLISDFGETDGYNYLTDDTVDEADLRKRQLSVLRKYKNVFGLLLSPFT